MKLLAIGNRNSSPGAHESREIRRTPCGFCSGPLRPDGSAVFQPSFEDLLLLFVQLFPDLVLSDTRDQPLVAVQCLFHLHHVVRHQLCGGIDGRQSAANHNRRQVHLKICQTVFFVSSRGLKAHQKIRCLAHASQDIIFHWHQSWPAGACCNSDVIKPELPCVLDGECASKTHPIKEPEFFASHQDQVVDIKKILVPSDRDPIFGNTSETEDGSLVQFCHDVLNVLDRSGYPLA